MAFHEVRFPDRSGCEKLNIWDKWIFRAAAA